MCSYTIRICVCKTSLDYFFFSFYSSSKIAFSFQNETNIIITSNFTKINGRRRRNKCGGSGRCPSVVFIFLSDVPRGTLAGSGQRQRGWRSFRIRLTNLPYHSSPVPVHPIAVGGADARVWPSGGPTIRYAAAATRQFNLPAGRRIKPRSSHTGGGGGRTRAPGGARTLALGLTRCCINGPPNVFYTDREREVMCSRVYKRVRTHKRIYYYYY